MHDLVDLVRRDPGADGGGGGVEHLPPQLWGDEQRGGEGERTGGQKALWGRGRGLTVRLRAGRREEEGARTLQALRILSCSSGVRHLSICPRLFSDVGMPGDGSGRMGERNILTLRGGRRRVCA